MAAWLAIVGGHLHAQDFLLSNEQFDMWLTNGNNRGVKQVESQLSMQIQEIDRICRLTPEQKEKLELAGRGDVARFDGRVEALRKQLVGRNYDQNKINEVWQKIQPLQAEMQAGILGDGSLFHKILLRTLEPGQITEFQAAEAGRRAQHYAAKVKLYVALLERSIAMTGAQRQGLVQLMTELTKPPQRFGQNEIYYVMFQASRLPEAKLAELFDENQTRVLLAAFRQGAGYEQFLKAQGFILPEDEAAEKPVDNLPRALLRRALIAQ